MQQKILLLTGFVSVVRNTKLHVVCHLLYHVGIISSLGLESAGEKDKILSRAAQCKIKFCFGRGRGTGIYQGCPQVGTGGDFFNYFFTI